MTKAELIRILEPFDDDIEIISFNEYDYKHNNILLFYSINKFNNEASLVIGNRKPNWHDSKLVQLVIK